MPFEPKKPALVPSIASALLLALTAPLAAVRQPDPDPVREREFRDPRLTIETLYLSPGELPSSASARAAADLLDLRLGDGQSLLDRRTERWATLLPAEPLVPAAAAAGSTDLEAAAWGALRDWVARHQGALRIDPAELREPGHVTVHRGGDVIQIHAPRVVGAYPVRDSYLTAVINHGNLVLFGVHNWGAIDDVPVPALTAEEAFQRTQQHLGGLELDRGHAKPALELIPLAVGEDPARAALGEGLEYRLAWAVRPRYAGTLAHWEALVDAVTGELLAFEDKTHYASTRKVIGGVYPVSNDGVAPDGIEQVYPLPFADVTAGGQTLFTDSGGNVQACVDGTISSTLAGPYLKMIDLCGAVSHSTSGGTLDFGTSGGTDCTTPGFGGAGNTHATRSGFYEINRIIEMGRSHLPNNTWVRQQLPATMNIDDVCNASGGPGGVNFFKSGGGCANTGELAGVFDHEWGHGMDGADATPGISNPGEGIADIYAALRLNTSCIGRNFRLGTNCGGYGDPCTSCDGVRDIDWAKRQSGAAHTYSWALSNPLCGGVHCRGAVYSEAIWDLWKRDLPNLFGMSDDTAHEVVTRMTFVGAGGVGTWFSGSPPSGGCAATNGYLNFLAADDDDGNLANGTPHMTAIHAAFDRHEIACGTPTVQASGCAGRPTLAPSVTATALDRATHLSWAAVAGADSYRVYRTEGEFGCAFGKTLVGETTGTSFLDGDGLANGREYSYVVFALGNGDTCFGPASACTDVTPAAGPNLALLAGSAAVDLDGDGDGFVDNCESSRVYFEVDNIGTGSLTDARIVAVSSPSHPALDPSISFPAAFAPSLPACSRAIAGFDFRGNGLAFGEVVEFEVEVTSDELEAQLPGQTKRATIQVPFVESDLQALASQTFSFESGYDGWTVAEGTFNRSGAGGGDGTTFSLRSSSFLDLQCDRVRSPLMQLSPTSTLGLWNNYQIEAFSGGTWWDRANVAIRRLDGSRTVVSPTGGRTYNASGAGDYSGCNTGEPGWAASQASWGTSSWNAAAFGALAPAGELVQLEVTYATDPAEVLAGFWFDQVTVTNLTAQVADAQGDVCGASALIFADDYESGGPFFWDATAP